MGFSVKLSSNWRCRDLLMLMFQPIHFNGSSQEHLNSRDPQFVLRVKAQHRDFWSQWRVSCWFIVFISLANILRHLQCRCGCFCPKGWSVTQQKAYDFQWQVRKNKAFIILTENIFYYISVTATLILFQFSSPEGPWVFCLAKRTACLSRVTPPSLPAWPCTAHPGPWSAPLPLPGDCRQPTHLLLRVAESALQTWPRNPCFLHSLLQESIQSATALLTQFHPPSRLPRFLNKKKAMFANSLTCFYLLSWCIFMVQT